MQRIRSLDLARGFTVLMIAPIHTVLVCSKLSVRETILGKFLACIAEGPGAPLFMLLMGLYTSFKPTTHRSAIKRSTLLLIGGLVLNTLRFNVPLAFDNLPAEILTELKISHPVQLIFIADILHFAAIAYLIIHLIKHLAHYQYSAAILAITIALISPLLWGVQSDNLLTNYIFQLAGGQPPNVFFPLFPWLVYPLTGLAIGKYISQKHIFIKLAVTAIPLIIVGFYFYEPSIFYRTLPGETLIHLGIVLITLYIWHLLSKLRDNYFFSLLKFSSKNITTIYFIQWVVIFWFLPVTGYQQLDTIPTCHAIFLTTFITYFTSFFIYEKFKKRNV